MAACLAMAACGNKVGHGLDERVPLGREFTLAPGQTAVVDDDLRLTVKSVADDSRCPVDVHVRVGRRREGLGRVITRRRAPNTSSTPPAATATRPHTAPIGSPWCKLEPAPRSTATISRATTARRFVVVR